MYKSHSDAQLYMYKYRYWILAKQKVDTLMKFSSLTFSLLYARIDVNEVHKCIHAQSYIYTCTVEILFSIIMFYLKNKLDNSYIYIYIQLAEKFDQRANRLIVVDPRRDKFTTNTVIKTPSKAILCASLWQIRSLHQVVT